MDMHDRSIYFLPVRIICGVATLCCLFSCVSPAIGPRAFASPVLIISVPEQKMALFINGMESERYRISTAKKGIGDIPGSYMTPAGVMEIAERFGEGLNLGSVLKDRVPTGEVIPVDAPGRDPIVSRILWLRGLEERNKNAFERFIYIHGTPQESLLGVPASFGCIRMRSVDIAALYDLVPVGTKVWVSMDSIETAERNWQNQRID
jgi:hypothetical protein